MPLFKVRLIFIASDEMGEAFLQPIRKAGSTLVGFDFASKKQAEEWAKNNAFRKGADSYRVEEH